MVSEGYGSPSFIFANDYFNTGEKGERGFTLPESSGMNQSWNAFDTFIGKERALGLMAVRSEIVKASGYAVLSLDWLRPLAQWIESG